MRSVILLAMQCRVLLFLWVLAMAVLSPGAINADSGVPVSTDPEDARPDRQEMRRYLSSKLTDEQAEAIIEFSKKQLEEAREQAAADGERFWRERAGRLAKCNEVYRLQHPDECDTSLPIMWQSIGQPPGYVGWRSLEEREEFNLLGICLYVETVRKAREFGCLPQK